MRPFPIRVTQYQYARLHALRDRDDLAVQEHVRRAIDEYLDRIESLYIRVDAHLARENAGYLLQAAPYQPPPLAPGQRKIPLPPGFAQTPPPAAAKQNDATRRQEPAAPPSVPVATKRRTKPKVTIK